jgi:hypothetical protein
LLLPVFACDILRDDIHLDLTNFIDNFLDIEIQKSIKRRNLLRYKTMLRKVRSDDSPRILCIDVVIWKTIVGGEQMAFLFGIQGVSWIHLDV